MKYSKKIYVGKKYKIRLFSWSWFRFRYKLKSGQLYFNNIKLIKRLKLDIGIVKNVFDENKLEVIKSNFDERIFALEEKLFKLTKINKNLISIVNEVNDEIDTSLEEKKHEDIYEVKTLQKYFEEKINEIEKIREKDKDILNAKYESLLEVIADNIADSNQFPNILSSDFNMQSIIDSKESSNSEKILYALFFLIRKVLADKGMSTR